MATPEQYIPNTTNPLSDKQTEVLHVIARGNPDGSPVDAYQLQARLSYQPKMDSVKFILRYMVAQKRVKVVGKEKRIRPETQRAYQTPVYAVTELGRSLIYAY